MSSVIMCDVCGKALEKPHFKLRILRVEEGEASNVNKTVGSLDMHDECLKVFKDWLKENRRKEQDK
jgi:hypothetical protein